MKLSFIKYSRIKVIFIIIQPTHPVKLITRDSYDQLSAIHLYFCQYNQISKTLLNRKTVGLKTVVSSSNIKRSTDPFGLWKTRPATTAPRNPVSHCNLFVNTDMALTRLSRLLDKCDDFPIVESTPKRFSPDLSSIILSHFKL